MDMEARSLAPDKGRPLQNKVREYKADLTSLREQLKQAAAGRATWAGSSNAAAACAERSCGLVHVLKRQCRSNAQCCEPCSTERGLACCSAFEFATVGSVHHTTALLGTPAGSNSRGGSILQVTWLHGVWHLLFCT
jgi:hypothetical protein